MVAAQQALVDAQAEVAAAKEAAALVLARLATPPHSAGVAEAPGSVSALLGSLLLDGSGARCYMLRAEEVRKRRCHSTSDLTRSVEIVSRSHSIL